MRKVTSGLFITLDGVTEAPNEWQFDNFDQDIMQELGKMIAGTDTVLMGRVTYQEWAGYWPTSTDEPFASFINNTPKYVVSTTLDKVDWQNSTLLKGNLAEEIARLKEQPGNNITVTGSPGLVESLLQNDLLDELILMVHPVIAGQGKRLFQNESSLKRMKLVSSKETSTGVMLLTYQPR
ncbi:MAG TPA: dihydrofolate reductase family protein [Chloroflexia bacterium]|nr:dihydrofolate reductase family protein [Chloroflexia bacterium]